VKKIILSISLFFLALVVVINSEQLSALILEKWKEFQMDSGSYAEREEEEEERWNSDQPDKFLEYHRGIRTRADQQTPGYSSNYKWLELKKARTSQLSRIRNGRTKSNNVTAWKERGPANVPGRIRALYAVPSDPTNNTWLAGAATGGIWRTTDGGNTWSERSADFPVLPISSFASDNSGSVIYAGTGEFVSSVFSALGNGIFKSTDNGISWTHISSTSNNPDFSVVTRIIASPSNANLVLATTVPHDLTSGTSKIMRSSDGGATWTKVKEVSGAFEQIIATPGNFATQFAAEKGVGVWKSIDAGITWNLSNSGMKPTGRLEIAISPVNPSRIYVSSEGTLSGSEADLYVSTNGGNTWGLVDVTFNGSVIDFLEGQGFYDNTILAHPFIENEVYFGGVSLFKTSVGTTSTSVSFFEVIENNTDFIFLQSFSNATEDQGRLTLGNSHDNITVEIRFGPGETQKAHRFEVPAAATSGVPAASYNYKNFVDVPFEVWDVTNNRQLMISFRDQNANGVFDLVHANLDGAANVQSREYLYVHNVVYDPSAPAPSLMTNGGQEVSMMYTIFPALAAAETWTPSSLPVSKLTIQRKTIQKFSANTVTVADGRGDFDDKNVVDQVNLNLGVHPDHHYMLPLIVSQTAKTFRLLVANDGGVFVSKPSTSAGTSNGDWTFKGFGLNTSQFYGADKRPGVQEYIGGMQDNGTRFSKKDEEADAKTAYTFGIGGDGFEVIWNSKNPEMMLGSIYYNQISRSINGGSTWQQSTTGFTPGAAEFPFVTKMANSKDFPDRVFTVGSSGVYRSENFGASWTLVPISSNFVIGTPFYLDVEVSRANANVVWAGSGMNNSAPQRFLHVSQDGGKTFSPTSNYSQVPLGNITKLASHPTQQNTAYAIFSFADSPKILRTTDLGQSWQDITGFGTNNESSNGFPDVAVFCLYIRPDNPDILWAGTEIGIVESLDNGATWSILDDFMNVSVWDMKGQDDEVVIATHGRGIWTATIPQKQVSVVSPEILAAGTSPDKKFAMRIKTEVLFDSVAVYAGTQRLLSLVNATAGTRDIAINNLPEGNKELKAIGYVGNSPYQSMIFKATHHSLLPAKNAYSTYFSSTSDLALQNIVHQNFPNAPAGQRKTLHTNHFYSTDTNYEVFIKTPVTVSNSVPTFYYSDIAVVEPDNDFIVVEATKNGLDWLPLAPGYDAAFNGDTDGKWLTAYLSKTVATVPMFVDHQLDISQVFSPGDLLLFRFRMISDRETTAWGWALNYISIQEPPVGTELTTKENIFTVFPNPSDGAFTISYELKTVSDVEVSVTDLFGRSVYRNQFRNLAAGVHNEDIIVPEPADGYYMVILKSKEGKKAIKVLLTK
jgi:hypothetical protein